jgi:hypothetical protein
MVGERGREKEKKKGMIIIIIRAFFFSLCIILADFIDVEYKCSFIHRQLNKLYARMKNIKTRENSL